MWQLVLSALVSLLGQLSPVADSAPLELSVAPTERPVDAMQMDEQPAEVLPVAVANEMNEPAIELAEDGVKETDEVEPARVEGKEVEGTIKVVDAEPVKPTDPEVIDWLDKIAAKQKDVETLKSRIRWDKIELLTGDEQLRFGELLFDGSEPARFALHLDRLVIGKRNETDKRDYIFDGKWLAEVRHKEKQFNRRQVVASDAKGEDKDPLALGNGPFPLPVRIDKERILKRFTVELVDVMKDVDLPERDQPLKKQLDNTVRLRMTPLPTFKTDLDQVDFWYEKDSLLPVRIEAIKDSTINSVWLFHDEKSSNAKLAKDAFDTMPPKERGWDVVIEPLKPANEETTEPKS